MWLHSRPHSQFPRLLMLIALGICPSCGVEPATPARPPTERVPAARPPAPPKSTARRTQARRPDPRYRPPTGIAELQTIAGEVARASGRPIRWRLQAGASQGPLVRIHGNAADCTIFVHPLAIRKVPPNTWAFLFGHEFAHLTENLGTHSATNPSTELKADIAGARYAMAAGYRIEAFLGWVLTEPDQTTASHGSLHQRVQSVATHFNIPRSVIQTESKRASQYRATH